MIVININIIEWTPLLWATQQGHADCVTLLINRGAAIDIRNDQGNKISNYLL